MKIRARVRQVSYVEVEIEVGDGTLSDELIDGAIKRAAARLYPVNWEFEPYDVIRAPQ